ncbi:hypothetical protein ACH5RR_000918 [Cinchona calisaya]|uniref:PPM-type phosphatase domain-containing protein n=1 Tax=Cinchona calisaya TaxID=153742 RepID=A0ABD3B340_9GENT
MEIELGSANWWKSGQPTYYTEQIEDGGDEMKEHLIIANLGDRVSRAVLCTRDDQDLLIAEQLTVDLKPNLLGEAKRIKSCQGRVMAMDGA